MPESRASVATEQPTPHLKQLCRRFGRRDELSVSWGLRRIGGRPVRLTAT